ncbi:hypothetical protein LZ32DRAFT_139293 [Colletotrichum eremochloae]|nr:hypothetical protein LZ32DRAFT_139293 [Colletotrichum eremochloae]
MSNTARREADSRPVRGRRLEQGRVRPSEPSMPVQTDTYLGGRKGTRTKTRETRRGFLKPAFHKSAPLGTREKPFDSSSPALPCRSAMSTTTSSGSANSFNRNFLLREFRYTAGRGVPRLLGIRFCRRCNMFRQGRAAAQERGKRWRRRREREREKERERERIKKFLENSRLAGRSLDGVKGEGRQETMAIDARWFAFFGRIGLCE